MDLQHMKMQILCLGLLILAAYVGGLIARRLKIGEVIGQIFGGIIVGPHFLLLMEKLLLKYDRFDDIVLLHPFYLFFTENLKEYSAIFEGYHFFVFLFLGIIAFSLEEELHRDRIRQVGVKAIIICVLQAMLTWILLSIGFRFIFGFSWINSLLIGSIGIATAPALIFILMNKLKIEGKLKSILANIVVLDDIIEVFFFSIFLSIAVSMKKGNAISLLHISRDLFIEFGLAIFIGVAIFLVLKFTLKPKLPDNPDDEDDETFLVNLLSKHSTPSVEVLLIIVAIIAIGIAVAINFELPFLITAVVAGFLISNFHSHAIFDSLKIGNVMPIFNLLFFGIIGSSVRLESFSLNSLWYIVGYIVLRSSGKIAGNYLGCRITRQDPKITAALPKLMLPQAGMAAVETILVLSLLRGAGGELIFNTVIPALVVFELGGAYLSEKTLLKWKTWITGEKEALTRRFALDTPVIAQFDKLVGDRAITMHATTKEEAIFELSRVIAAEKNIKDISILTNPILEREKLSSTSTGSGIAFPHCRSEFVSDVTVVCGVLQNPIDWSTIDGVPLNLLFLIVSPKEKPEKHLKALSVLSSLLARPDFPEKIIHAVSQDSFGLFKEELLLANTAKTEAN